MQQKAFYITTTLPYVNSDPHVGFAMEIIRADVLARYYRAQGREVFFNTGTDEHGAKIQEAAEGAGIDPQVYTDGFAETFKALKETLNLSYDNFIRTTDMHHVAAAQAFWKMCDARGDIYKKNYSTKYCVGCELAKTDSELVDGKCPIHPNRDIELRDEENYFFKFSNYTQKLLDFYAAHPDFIIPDFRYNETKAFVSRGLEDFSISRLKEKMSWGVPVPGDEGHVMYVWFDALVNYISCLGWPDNAQNFEKFWKNGQTVQYCGKDNNRQQSAMWQAMLMSAFGDDSHNTDTIIIDGFINSGGQKMSKSLGNVIRPGDITDLFAEAAGEQYLDVLRYYLLRHVSSFEDSDMTLETVQSAYESGLANGLGNLASRVLTLTEKHVEKIPTENFVAPVEYAAHIEKFDLQKAMEYIWSQIGELDKFINDEKPFSVIKTDEVKGKDLIAKCGNKLFVIASMLAPFLPDTSEVILSRIRENRKPAEPLFKRLEK